MPTTRVRSLLELQGLFEQYSKVSFNLAQLQFSKVPPQDSKKPQRHLLQPTAQVNQEYLHHIAEVRHLLDWVSQAGHGKLWEDLEAKVRGLLQTLDENLTDEWRRRCSENKKGSQGGRITTPRGVVVDCCESLPWGLHLFGRN